MPKIIDVDAETAKKWVDDGDATLIDVRESPELDEVKITGAQHNPMSQFDPDALPNETGKKLIFICAHGMRSVQVGQYLLNSGKLNEAYNMTGGTAAWAQAGLPFEYE